jgi:hypothetical protein
MKLLIIQELLERRHGHPRGSTAAIFLILQGCFGIAALNEVRLASSTT